MSKYKIMNVNFDKQIEGAPIVKATSQGWVKWGIDNLYPYKLINLFNQSVTHRACIDFAINAIVGNGIDYEALGNSTLDNPNPRMTWDTFIRSIAFDYVMYGGFAFQVIKNRGGSTYSFFPQPLETIRLAPMDGDGNIVEAWLSSDWSNTSKYPPQKVTIMAPDEDMPLGEVRLVYYRKPNPVNDYYPLPTYSSALNAIMAEAQFQTYDLKNVVNGFTPSGALTLPNVETEEERNEMLRQIQQMFSGAENANTLIVTFRNNIEDKPIEYTPFAQSSENINLYGDANERTVNRIMAAHKVPSKSLIGYPADDTGFSDSGAYMQTAFDLYNVNVANANRREITNVINGLLAMNGVDMGITLLPLRYQAEPTEIIDVENNEEEQ